MSTANREGPIFAHGANDRHTGDGDMPQGTWENGLVSWPQLERGLARLS